MMALGYSSIFVCYRTLHLLENICFFPIYYNLIKNIISSYKIQYKQVFLYYLFLLSRCHIHIAQVVSLHLTKSIEKYNEFVSNDY